MDAPPEGKADDPIDRARRRLGATPKAISSLREEVRRLREEGNRLRRTAALLGQIHHWSEALLEGELVLKEVLSGIASGQGLRRLFLWKKEESVFHLIGRDGSGGLVDARPVKVGLETAGATWAMGKPRFFKDLSLAPTAVQEGVQVACRSLLSLPLRGCGGGWVLEAMDHLDGNALGSRALEEIPILAPWAALAASPVR